MSNNNYEIERLEKLIPAGVDLEGKYFDKFAKYSTCIGNGVYHWRGINETDTRILFLKGALLLEGIDISDENDVDEVDDEIETEDSIYQNKRLAINSFAVFNGFEHIFHLFYTIYRNNKHNKNVLKYVLNSISNGLALNKNYKIRGFDDLDRTQKSIPDYFEYCEKVISLLQKENTNLISAIYSLYEDKKEIDELAKKLASIK